MSKHLEVSHEDADTLLNGIAWICSECGGHQEVANLVGRIIGLYPELEADYGYILEKAAADTRITLTESGYRAVMQQGAKLNGEVKAGEE